MSASDNAELAPADQGSVECRICGSHKSRADFYPRQIRICGLIGECKECTKVRVRSRRAEAADYYRAYDRKRYREQPHRKEAAQASAKSPSGEASRERSLQRLKAEAPEKYRARNAINNAIRSGKIERGDSCHFCGEAGRLHAHHEDYDHPLDVVWLCPSCHGKLHAIKGDFRRTA